jgi:hypothetical protein
VPLEAKLVHRKFSAAVLLGLALLFFGAAPALAETRTQFCSRWNQFCNRVCTPEGLCGTCPSLYSTCLATGCFNFRSGPRCETTAVPTCSEQYANCARNPRATAEACAAARATCMRTGRWIYTGTGTRLDYGPAQKR